MQDSGIQVIEVSLPRVCAEAGAQDDAHGMAVSTFVAETMSFLTAHPEAGQVVVDAVSPLRHADRRGECEKVYATGNPAIEEGSS